MLEITELLLLNFSLTIAFILAPLTTRYFFLNNSRIYSNVHKITLVILLISVILGLNFMTGIWVLFCVFGLFLHLYKFRLTLSIQGFTTYIPFIFSIISSVWFFAGVNDLHLLGYNRAWSFYAALHGGFLGWIFVGCLAYLSRKPDSSKLYLWGCYLSFVFFLSVAFGIDGIPYIKRIGVIGLSVIIPLVIGHYTMNLEKEKHLSRFLAVLSLFSIVVSMILALLNEFWAAAPRIAFGIPLMVLTHGLMNTIITIPCFFFAIRFESNNLREF